MLSTIPTFMMQIADPREAWKVAFYVGAGISAIGGVIVLATLKTEVQDWAKMEDDFYDTEDTKKKREPSITPTENDESGETFFKSGPVWSLPMLRGGIKFSKLASIVIKLFLAVRFVNKCLRLEHYVSE